MPRFLLAIIILLTCHNSNAQTFNGPGGTIPDLGATLTCFPLTVTGIGNINGSFGLASVCLNITHGYDGDLDIYLEAPDGTYVPLSIENGGINANFTNTCFTTTAATSITTGTPPYSGSFLPEGNLGAVNNGQNANGVWNLCIQDVLIIGAGTLNNWSISFNNSPALPPVLPANDNPCFAIPLAVTAACSYTNLSTLNAGNSAAVPAPGCANYLGGDVWFQTTVPAGGALVFDTQAGTMTDGGMAIYTGNCNTLTLIACDDDGSSNINMPKITAGGLTPGSTVWIRVWSYGNAITGTFGICITTPPPAPLNDNPCNAVLLTVGTSCNYTNSTTLNATATAGVAAPGCASYAGGDVWFQATVPAGGALMFDTQTGTITDAGMAIYSGTCSALTFITCDDDGSTNGNMPMITAGGLLPGSIVWIRVWEYNNDGNGTFGICVTTPPPPPANDEPCNATVLTVGATCNYSNHTNVSATASPGIPAPACGTYSGHDVWFKVIVPASGSVFLDALAGTMFDADMAVYAGTCNSLTLLRCDDFGSATNSPMPSVTLTGQTPGNTLWIRFWDNAGDNAGTFGLCASEPPPPNHQDCPAAIPLCQNVYNQAISYSGTGNIGNEINPANSCLGAGERADVWYTLTVQNSGFLNFTITPNTATEDYDWEVYNLTGHTCSDIYSNPALSVSCNFSATPGATGPTRVNGPTSQDAAGTPRNQQIPVIAGETYLINVSNYSSSTHGYSIDFSASTASIFDNVAPYLQSVNAASICGGNQLAVNFSENVLCNTLQNADFAITGPGGPYSVTGWTSASCASGATYGNNITLAINPPLNTNGTYQVCLTNASGSVTDLCGNVAPPACLNFTIATTVPVFNIAGTLCTGAAAPVLPLTSNNGVTGTWLPSTVSNSTTGTYIFTPATGQCAVPLSVTVIVTSGIVSTFNSIGPVCNGTSAPVLPLTSTNGITGTWSPSTISNTASGSYTFTPTAGQCGLPVTIPVTITAPIVPLFSPIASICSGSTAPVLPGTSSNGITGTWNPATVNNMASASYTFTPNAGQCGSVVSITINVSSNILPAFNAIPAICQGSASIVLPTISTNGITGSWSPATVSNTTTGIYTFTPNAGQCATTAILTVTVNSIITPTFNPIPAFCSGSLSPILPVSSINGITGTWMPAIINNNVSGIYFFIPAAGQCATTATLPVTVNSPVSSTTNMSICDNQLPYNWNGNNYPTAGTYPVTLISALGCDSVATLNLTIKPVVTSTTNISVCNNQLPYNWNSNNYPTAGTYAVTLVSAAGCDSVATLNLTINPVVTSTTNISVCNNQLPYNWNGNNYPTAGTYAVTLVSAAGCDSVATLNLTINPIVTSTTNISVCNNQLPYSWNGNSYSTAGNYNVTLVSSAGCDSIATLNLISNAVVTSSNDITICNNQLPYSWNGNSYPTAGTYAVTLVSAAGCDSVATLNITVNLVVTSTTNISVCNNQLPYSWNGNSYLTAGTYTVTLVSAAGCDSVATLNLTIKPVVTSTTNISVCNNQLPYNWNGNNYPTGGTYAVTLVSAAGCDSVATLNITVNPVVTSTTNISVCNNQLPYSWNGNSYSTAGNYNVTLVSSTGCDSIPTLNLIVDAVVTSSTNITICNNQLPYSWNGNSYSTPGNYNVTLVSSTGCDSIATLNLIVDAVVTSSTHTTICNNQLPYSWNGNSYSTAGTYTVNLVSSAGCDSIATLNLVANTVISSSTDITICNNQLPYSWNGNSYSTAGIYTVNLVSSTGCDSIATLNLIVDAVVTSSTDITICNNQLPYSWNGNNYSTAGTYTVTLVSAAGCDSIATLNLIANNMVTSSTDITICNNQLPYSWNGNSYSTAGIYTVNLVSSAGCDSIATLNLTANAVVTSSTDITICNNQLPYSWNGNSYSTAGIYTVNLVSSAGCDSIATLNLTANAVVTSSTNITICNNQLPYSWNGNSYSTPGTYNVTLVSSAGCDSIATLNLTANAVVTSSTNITICNNQLPYSWNGNSYSTAGNYNVILVSSAGCDSIATLNLLTNNIVNSSTDITICNNQLPYSWNGNSYSTEGNYTVTLVSAAGCDSIATLNLISNAVVTSSTDITICNNQLPYSWNGNSYSTAGNYTITLLSSSGCDSIATLNLTANAVVTSSTNITICNNQLPYSWNGNSYSTAGTYTVTLASSAGCDSIATLNLIANNMVTSSTNITICNNQLPYSWNGNSYPTAGTYTVTFISNSGCDSIATLNLTANAVVTSSTNIRICNNQLPYSWNGNSYSTAGTYTVNLVSSAGCDSIATLNLFTNNIVNSSTDITVCNNQLPYLWNGNSYSTAGNYMVTLVSAAGCDSIATLNLTANAVVTSSTNITICNNQLPYSWNGNSYSTAGTYTVTLVSAAGCDSIATLNLIANNMVTSSTDITICNNQLPFSWNGNSYSFAGTYNVTLVSSAGCDSIATLNLVANTVISSSTDITICNNQLPYSWNGNSYSTAGIYTVNLVSSAGCDSIATLNLTVDALVTSSTNITICNNQLPYSWNGNSYSTSGTYNVTLVSSAGCDSIATLNLIVNAVVTGSTNITICNNQLPYLWNGNSYSTEGTYTVNLVGSAGCDSIATLNLVANNMVTSLTNITICSNQLPYSWNGNSYPTAGTYTANLVSSAGCDSIATLNLVANNMVTSLTNITICSNQLPYSWNGNSYPTAGTYTANLVSSAGCDSIATLNLVANNMVTSLTDITICNNQLPFSWNGNSYSTPGTYTANLVSSAGCDSIATLNLIANTAVTSSTDITICNNQLPYSWNGNSYSTEGTYTTNLVSSAGCDSIATLNLTANAVVTSSTNITICNNQLPYSWNGNSYPTAGTYTVTLVSADGCDSVATLNLTINPVVTSTTNISVCNNQLPYNWNGNNYPTAGTYSVTLVSSAGCDSIATLNLIANNMVTSSTDITICNNQLPFSWNGNSYSFAGTYNVTLVSSAGCDSIATLNLIANNIVTSSTDITICNNQLPYSWNGNSYSTPGTYTANLVSSAGCDSIATLNLLANNMVTSSTDISICNNQLPYSWNGNSYPTAGTYTVTFVSNAGCDSIATLNLILHNPAVSTSFITLCNNQIPYTWNGNSYADGGTYSVTLLSNTGCDSVATLHLAVNAAVASSTAIIICNNQIPYNWNGNNYAVSGTYLVTLNSSNGCDSIASLHLTIKYMTTSLTNTVICASQLPYIWNGQSYLTAGSYSASLTNTAGCDSIATLNLTVNPIITSITAASTCNNHLPYNWNGHDYSVPGLHSITLSSAAGCDSIATLNLTVNTVKTSNTIVSTCENLLPYLWNGNIYQTAGIYSITLSSAAGCDSIATLQLTINPVKTSSTNISICSSELPYSWNGQTYLLTGAYNVTLTSAANCDSLATLNLIVNPTPALPAVSSPVSYCQFETTNSLFATITTTNSHLVWYTSANGGTGSLTAPVPSSANAGTVTYYVSQVNGLCEGQRISITVTINGKPDLGQDKPLRICFGQSADISTLYNTAGNTSEWSFSQQNVSNPGAVGIAGIYQLISVSNSGCSDTALVNLGIQPPVTANAGNDDNAEYNAAYQLHGTGGTQYQWSPATSLNNPFISSPVAVLTHDETFTLMVMDEIGCFALDTVKLRVFNGPTFYVPNAFSPNGDGQNEIFRPTAVGIASLEYFSVFNRYGELVFETHDLGKGWDGIYKGKKQPVDNYVWKLKGTDRKGNVKTMRGNVILIR